MLKFVKLAPLGVSSSRAQKIRKLNNSCSLDNNEFLIKLHHHTKYII